MPFSLLSVATPSLQQSGPTPTRLSVRFALASAAALLLLPADLLAAGTSDGAPKPAPAEPAAPRPAAEDEAAWQVSESENFRVLSYGTEPVGPEVNEQCESLRFRLYEKWLSAASPPAWRPRCEIVLHATDSSYLRAVGAAAARTVASSLTRQSPGSSTVRRIDIRATRANWLSSALPHEIMHVLLADQFSGQKLPRWIDEGVAVLADPLRKQQLHLLDAQKALTSRDAFRAVELLALKDYPAADRWPVFYGQSMSLVKFLVEQRTPEEFLHFVRLSLDCGYDPALQEIYQIDNVAELERRWLADVTRQSADETTIDTAQTVHDGPQSTTRRGSVEPQSGETKESDD